MAIDWGTRALTIALVVCGCVRDNPETHEGGASSGASSSAAATSVGTGTTHGTTTGGAQPDATEATLSTTTASETGTDPEGEGSAEASSTTSGATGDACFNRILDGGEVDVDCGGSCPACPTGSVCNEPPDCESKACETGTCLGPALGCDLDQVQGPPGGVGWADSYSVDGRCYCASSFDHNIGELVVDTPAGPRTVLQICEALGAGPGIGGNPMYNDIQCGHGPANDAGDEDWCPGRVDQGTDGCCTAGPTWDLSIFER
ncbi:MAG: hypothetical protein ACRBN8_24980 [Nannocystales bacterium]